MSRDHGRLSSRLCLQFTWEHLKKVYEDDAMREAGITLYNLYGLTNVEMAVREARKRVTYGLPALPG
jgi:hypothetical protein